MPHSPGFFGSRFAAWLQSRVPRESAIDVGERHRHEVTEMIGPLGDEIRRVFVDASRHLPSLALVPTDNARRSKLEYSGRDLLGVHHGDRALGRPLRENGARGIAGPRARRHEWAPPSPRIAAGHIDEHQYDDRAHLFRLWYSTICDESSKSVTIRNLCEGTPVVAPAPSARVFSGPIA